MTSFADPVSAGGKRFAPMYDAAAKESATQLARTTPTAPQEA
ncbi:MAG: hypothetical protein ACXW5U_27065 [Thermoanaerobaculia bacterium]